MKHIDPADDAVVDELVSMSLALAERKLSSEGRSNRSAMDRKSEERSAHQQGIPERGDDRA
jgi:hypothetical protein